MRVARRRRSFSSADVAFHGGGSVRPHGTPRTAGLGALPRPVAVVVGAGGVLGAAHIGVGYALEQRGFVPDMIVGTSVGALNGAIAAAHPDRAAPWLDHVWTRLRRRDVYPLGRLSERTSVFTDRGLRRLIARAELPSRIEQLAVLFTAVAMDLVTGAQVPLDRGDLESALLASAAIPGMLPPVDRAGRTLVDGGVIAYVPVLAALQAGAASVVVVAAGPENSPLPTVLPRRRAGAIAGRAGLLLLHHQIERDLREVSQHIPTVVLPTGIEDWPAPWDFGHSQRLIDTACFTAGLFLDGLRISGPGLYRVDDPSTTSTGPDRASVSFTTGVHL
ncbi:patatin-like phospholipase family protein [Streptomyces sp. MBT62]|uniref:patatin-like phospholipase family protein n=1 Tax=Streptomyces sp. MBT62 TaxID=2800410 RepID=UPI00190B199D|nr:patatin-like phospholipase family protein [Streptomyces sp. MBT62]MBK3567245.1 patatin-like phospholipase family protein [Streptomyces sp. MBT62]